MSNLRLPKELWQEIFCKIPAEKLSSFDKVCRVCRAFHTYINEDYFWKLNFERTYVPVDSRIDLHGYDTWEKKYKKCWHVVPTLPKLGIKCTYLKTTGNYCWIDCMPGKNYCFSCQRRVEAEAAKSTVLHVKPYKSVTDYFIHAETGLILKADNNVIYAIAQDTDGHVQLPSEDVKPYIDALNLKIPDDQIEQLYVLLNKITKVR